MALLDKYDLTKSVVFSNDMLKSKYYTQKELELTLQQKRLLMYMISKIEPSDTELRSETIQISDYCELFGINYDGRNKEVLRNSLKELLSKVFFLPVAPRKERSFRWVDRVEIDYTAGTLTVKLDDSLKEYYIGLKKNFAIFQLGYTVNFTSKYSYTLYELIKTQHKMKHFFYISVAEAKKVFVHDDVKYKNFANFKKNVLDIAVAEVNKKTDVDVQMKCVKNGRSYEIIEFYTTKKRGSDLAEVDKWKIKSLTKHEKIVEDMNVEWKEQEEFRLKYADPEADEEFYQIEMDKMHKEMMEAEREVLESDRAARRKKWEHE